MFKKVLARFLKTFGIFAIVLPLLCSCGAQMDGADGSSQDESSHDNASKENNSVSIVSSGESGTSQVEEDVQSFKKQFESKYIYSLDPLYLVTIDDYFYQILVENPIDAWYDEEMAKATSPNSYIEVDEVAQANWSREIKSSLQVLCELLPERTQSFVDEQEAWEYALEIKLDNIQQIARDLFIDGSEQYALLATEQTKLMRERAFYLMYMEYVTVKLQSPPNSINLEQMFEIQFVEG